MAYFFEQHKIYTNAGHVSERVYEADFLDCSYGFRSERSCDQAINAVDKTLATKPINYVIEADIKDYILLYE